MRIIQNLGKTENKKTKRCQAPLFNYANPNKKPPPSVTWPYGGFTVSAVRNRIPDPYGTAYAITRE